MKKKVCAKIGATMGAFLALALPGQAHSNPVCSGFYAGLSAGVSSLSGNQNFTSNNTVDPGAANTFNFKVSSQSIGGGLFGGYGYRVNYIWLGAELSYLVDRLESKETANHSGHIGYQVFKAKSTGALGLSFHLGYVPTDGMIVYGILGLESRRFQVSALDQFTNDHQFFSDISKKYNSIAFVPGVGARINLTKNVSLRAEYKYALHRSKTITASAQNLAGGGGTDTSVIKTSPRIQIFHIGLVYSF